MLAVLAVSKPKILRVLEVPRVGIFQKYFTPRYGESVQICMFSLICSRRGGSAAVVLIVALDTVVGESRKKTPENVTRSPTRFCSTGVKLCYFVTMDA